MNTSNVLSTKPYLLRAIFEWAEDNGFTPQVLVNAKAAHVEVPLAHVVDGQIVLNISSSAVQLHVMDNDCLSFSARFGGVEHDIFLPIDSILAIFARENSQGIFFEEQDVETGSVNNNETQLSAVDSETNDFKKNSKNQSKPSIQLDRSEIEASAKPAKNATKDEPSSEMKGEQKGQSKDKDKRDTSHLKIIK